MISDLKWKKKRKLKVKQLVERLLVFLWRRSQKHTLKPPILWSFLNSFPFLYQRREGTGFPFAWHRNFTVLLAGTAWSCFSIFSGITHWGANAGKVGKHHDYNNFSLPCLFSTQKQTKRLRKREQFGLRWIFSLLADNSSDGLFSSEDDSSSSSSSEDFTASATREVRCLKVLEDTVLTCANRTADLLTGSLRRSTD